MLAAGVRNYVEQEERSPRLRFLLPPITNVFLSLNAGFYLSIMPFVKEV